MTRFRTALVVVVAAGLLAVGCAPTTGTPGATTSGNGKPLPTSPYQPKFPYVPGDGPKLLAALQKQLGSSKFLASLDPARKDEMVAAITAFLAAPDAVEQAEAFIAAQVDEVAEHELHGTVPPKLTTEEQRDAGGPDDILAGIPDDPPDPDEPADPPPYASKRGNQAVVADLNSMPDSSEPIVDLHDTLSQLTWPPDSPTGWPVSTGDKADQVDALRNGSQSGNETPEPAVTTCNSTNTGTRPVPGTPIPAYRAQLFTPPQDSWLTRDHVGYAPVLRDPNDPASAPEVRFNQALNIWQLHVEAHLLSPIANTHLSDIRAIIHMERLGEPSRLYYSSYPNTEWHVYCYFDDLGQQNPQRGYLDAWIPIGRALDSNPDNRLLGEPGFQLRVETVDNWNTSPTLFLGADQRTVHIGTPVDHAATISRGAFGARVDDGVIVDRDGVVGNDLETLINGRVVQGLQSAFNSLQGATAWGWTMYNVSDIDPNDVSMDLDLVPLSGTEYKFRASVDVWDLWFRGFVGFGWSPCYTQSHLAAHVVVNGVLDVGNPDRTKLAPRVLGVQLSNVSHWGTYMNILRPTCASMLGAYDLISSDLFALLINTKIAEKINEKLAEPSTASAASVVNTSVLLGSGNGFTVKFPGFETTGPYQPVGGNVGITADGVHLLAEAGIDDLKAPSDPRRFPLVYGGVLSTSMLALGYTTNTPTGHPYDLGFFLHPELLNQLLRSLTEGSSTTSPNGIFDQSANIGGYQLEVSPQVAPIYVDTNPVPNQPLPAATVFVPDLRVTDNQGHTFAVNGAVGAEFTIDASTRKLIPTLTIGIDVDTMVCGGTLYAICANNDWQGGNPSAVPSVPQVINWVGNTLVPQLLANSLGEVQIPTITGFDPLVLGNVEIKRANGALGIYLGT